MADYTINPSYVYVEESGHRTQIISMEDGGEVRNSYGTVHRIFTLNYDKVTATIKDSIITFFTSKVGRTTSFTWENPNDSTEYTVRFINESLEIEEVDYQMYNIKISFVEVV